MAERKRMGDAELKGIVAREISLAKSDNGHLSKRRTKAREYFEGKMTDIAAEEGRSSAVSKDLADTMGWMQPGLMRVFCASDQIALCEPVGDDDEEFARHATIDINHVFWKENDGYRVLYDGCWDSLLGGNGVIKVYRDNTPKDVISYHSGLTDEALAELVAGDDIEVLAHTPTTEMLPSLETGELAPTTIHEVKITRKVTGGKTCVLAMPPENYGIDGDAKTSREARFQYHRERKTRSDLIQMGFDRDLVDSLGIASRTDSPEESARDNGSVGSDSDTSTDLVDFYECYLRVDVDGDGIAEMVKIDYAGDQGGGEILGWEKWEDEAPFYDIPCNPMPHQWVAQSIFDETEDVQQIKTVMLRQANDNTYASNNPQRFVKGKINNPEELFSPSFGGAIFGDINSEVTNLSLPFVANHAYDALAYQDQVIQRRTGVSRQTMALDPEALNNQSATANQNEKDASYSQVELVARNMAEFGWVYVFKAILRLEVKHQSQTKTIRMAGKPVKMDPKWWNTDMDVTVNVGLGTGSRDRDLAMLGRVLETQLMMADRFMAAGAVDDAIDLLPKILNTLVKMAESAGLRNPDNFYPEYTEEKVAHLKALAQQRAEQGDPQVAADAAKAKAEMEMQAAKMQGDQQNAKAKMAMEQARSEQDMALKREQLAAEMALKREQLAAELQLKRDMFAAELQMKREMGIAGLAVKADASTSAVQMGGDPG